jgi:hypothetical protein
MQFTINDTVYTYDNLANPIARVFIGKTDNFFVLGANRSHDSSLGGLVLYDSFLLQLNLPKSDTTLIPGNYAYNSGMNANGIDTGGFALGRLNCTIVLSDTVTITSFHDGLVAGTFNGTFADPLINPETIVHLSNGVFRNVSYNPNY